MPYESRLVAPGVCIEFFLPMAVGSQVAALNAASLASRVEGGITVVASCLPQRADVDRGGSPRESSQRRPVFVRLPSFRGWRKELSKLRRSLGLTGSSNLEPWRLGVAWISAPSPNLSSYVPPHPDRVPGLMRELHHFIGGTSMSVVHALAAYVQFLLIHPFPDGNRRTAEGLLMQLLETRQSLARDLVQCLRRAQSERRTDLFNALRKIQMEGDWTFYFEIVADTINSIREDSRQVPSSEATAARSEVFEDVLLQEQSVALLQVDSAAGR